MRVRVRVFCRLFHRASDSLSYSDCWPFPTPPQPRRQVDADTIREAIAGLRMANVTCKEIAFYIQTNHPELATEGLECLRRKVKLTVRRMVQKDQLKKQPAVYSL